MHHSSLMSRRVLLKPKKLLVFPVLITIPFFSAQLAAEESDIEKRINALEQKMIEKDKRIDELEINAIGFEDRLGSRALARAFEASSLDIGGFLHQTLTYADGEDGNSTSFNRTVFELLVKAQFNEDWSAFMAQAFMRQSDDPFVNGSRFDPQFNSNSGTDTVIAWAQYRFNDSANLQIGRFISPQGIINIEHFPAILLEPEQPQFLRPFGSDTIFSNFVTGLHFYGNQFVGNNHANQLSYHLYTGNAAKNPNDLVYGARVAYQLSDQGVTFGLNANGGERNNTEGGSFNTWGADVLIDKGAFQLKTEIFSSDETPVAGRDDRLGWYIQPIYKINASWTSFYRYDFLDNGKDEGDSVENILGVTFKPIQNIHLRATYTRKTLDANQTFAEADMNIVQLSGTFSF